MDRASRTIRRRRREGKTDYKLRLGILKSGKARIVVRRTNKHIIGQIIVSDIAQDKIIVTVNSKDLIGMGWPESMSGGLKSLPAAYLTGFMLGNKAGNIKEGVFDIGLQRSIGGSRLYAFLKGVVDSGFNIGHSENIFPSDEKLTSNEKYGKFVSEIKERIK
jgi:large subunit ribosomal protein L18